jgi:hypothetical protein
MTVQVTPTVEWLGPVGYARGYLVYVVLAAVSLVLIWLTRPRRNAAASAA